jgi:putative ABC transport system substrate-binding protein
LTGVRAALLALAFAAGPLLAQPPPSIGYLGFQGEAPQSALQDAFVSGLREHGYAPGKNIRFEARPWKNADELRRHLSDFARAKVDVIFVGPPIAALTARGVTGNIPIICGSCGDPVENGLAKTLARPEGNVSGLASLSAELIGKRFQLLKEVLPNASRVAALVFPNNPGTPPTLKALERIGSMLHIEIQLIEVRRREDLAPGFKSASQNRASAVVVQDDPLVRVAASDIAQLGIAYKFPVVAGLPEAAAAGSFMSYGPDRVEMARRAAGWVDRILKGAKPGDLPFEQAEKLELIVNLKTAKAIDLAVPNTLILRATRTIE